MGPFPYNQINKEQQNLTSIAGLSMLALRLRWLANNDTLSNMVYSTRLDHRMCGNWSTMLDRNLSANLQKFVDFSKNFADF